MGEELGEIPQTETDKSFDLVDLRKGFQDGIYNEVTHDHAMNAKEQGAIISSAFMVWQERERGPKGRFVVNLSLKSTFWKKGSVKMDNLAEFAMNVQQGDHFLSMDVEKGY